MMRLRGLTTLMWLTACALLAGCADNRIAAWERADDEACKAQPTVDYAVCRTMRTQYRHSAAQQDVARSIRMQ